MTPADNLTSSAQASGQSWEDDPEKMAQWVAEREMSENKLLYERVSIFLTASSIVVVAFANAVPAMDLFFLLGNALLGLVISLAWGRVVRRQFQIVRWLKDLHHKCSPFYRQWQDFRKAKEEKEPEVQHSQVWIVFRLQNLFLLFWIGALIWLSLAVLNLLPTLTEVRELLGRS